MRFCASSRLLLPRSAAAKPSAIFFWRSSSARISGGQMNFIVPQAPMRKTTSWMNSVALIFMGGFGKRVQQLPSGHGPTGVSGYARRASSRERIGEREHHGDTDADQERGVDQANQQEHLRLQCVHQFGLACRGFDVFAAHQ